MRAFLLIAVLLMSAGAGAAPAERHWTVDGVDRKALVYAPSARSAGPAPLVFAFHGHGGRAALAAAKFHLQDLWPEAIVVYMQGLPTAGRLLDHAGRFPGWQQAAGDHADRDLRFFDAVLASMRRDYRVDERRIYAMGHSNGGYFTYLLWSERPSVFAAFAPAAAAYPGVAAALAPKPAIHVAGTGDPLVPFAVQERTMTGVRAADGCSAHGVSWPGPPGLTCTEYRSSRGAPFVSAVYEGGHMLPAGAFAAIVQFFRAHPKPG